MISIAFPEFGPTFHSIGHALAVELLRTNPSLECGDTSITGSPAAATAESFDWIETYAA
jgi:hypothetical protein